jgi:basic amino acid/polyamine antiporter, APA family
MSSLQRRLTLFDAVCLIVGVIVGAGIYEFAPSVAAATSSSWGVLGLWAAGGLLSLMGAMCYAELAAAYPQAGGDYVYLSRAYGRWAGFIFGWGQLSIVRPGDIASLSLIFAHHMYLLLYGSPGEPGSAAHRWLAISAIVLLTTIHLAGLREGKWTQNVLTVAKVVGIVFVLAIAFTTPTVADAASATPRPDFVPHWSLAIVLILFTFGGWNEMAYLAAELHRPEKNVLRGLLIGSLAVTGIYLLMNMAFLHVLGHEGLARSTAVGAATVTPRLPVIGGRLINALICISTLGAASGLIFTGARISYALGSDYPLFGKLGTFHARGTPTWALLAQCLLAVSLVAVFGHSFETVILTSVAVYLFFMTTSIAVIVLRFRDPQTPRPYRVTGYPWTVIVFAGVAGYLFYSVLMYRPPAAVMMLGVLAAGGVLYAVAAGRQSDQRN